MIHTIKCLRKIKSTHINSRTIFNKTFNNTTDAIDSMPAANTLLKTELVVQGSEIIRKSTRAISNSLEILGLIDIPLKLSIDKAQILQRHQNWLSSVASIKTKHEYVHHI